VKQYKYLNINANLKSRRTFLLNEFSKFISGQYKHRKLFWNIIKTEEISSNKYQIIVNLKFRKLKGTAFINSYFRYTYTVSRKLKHLNWQVTDLSVLIMQKHPLKKK
jgi:hypothetical protein